MVKKFQINLSISNKLFYTLIVVGVIGLLGVGVYAYNSGASPSVMGHSAEEIEGVCRTDGTGCPAETDPKVLASVKDGVSWSEIIGIPACFADKVDNVGSSTITCSCGTCWAVVATPALSPGPGGGLSVGTVKICTPAGWKVITTPIRWFKSQY